jgi:hypothetical protein
MDTLYAEANRIDEQNWSITFSYTNDATIVGMSIPFHFKSGLTRVVADSVVWTDRVSHFTYKSFRPDTAIQCATLGLIANMGKTYHEMAIGRGPIATVYISSLEDVPVEKLAFDTTTTHPNNSLMVMADWYQGTPPDTVKVSHTACQIFPAFVVKGKTPDKPEKQEKKE